MSAFAPTQAEIKELLVLCSRCIHTQPNSELNLNRYITAKQIQDTYYKAPFNQIVEIAVEEKDIPLLKFSISKGGKAPESTLTSLQEDSRYEDIDYDILNVLLGDSQDQPDTGPQRLDIGPRKWISEWNKMLMKAAIDDQTRFVELYLTHPPWTMDLDYTPDMYKFQLSLVVEKSSVATARLFIEYSALFMGTGALARAARAGNSEMVDLLLSYGSDINDPRHHYQPPFASKREDFGSAFHEAVLHGRDTIVEIFLKKEPNFEMNYFDGRTLSDLARDSENDKVVALLKGCGAIR